MCEYCEKKLFLEQGFFKSKNQIELLDVYHIYMGLNKQGEYIKSE